MIFASPHWLWALLALPLLLAAEAWGTRRDRERTARLVARPLWKRVVRRTSERWRWARTALLALAAAGVALALARPQWGIVREKVEREGVDVVLVLDTSGSMATEDVQPNRLFFARAALQSLVSQLEGDRFALVAFEGEAYPLVPLTLDADAVGLFLEAIEPGTVPAPGSSLGVGLARGLELFTDKERRNKVLVLVSDGEDLEGQVEEAARRAKQAGVVVHTVGVGTEQGQPVPDFDREGRAVGFKKDASGAVVVSRLVAHTLETVARETGGRYFRLSPAESGLAALASTIEAMEGRALVQEYSYRRKERYQVPLGVGLAALAAALLLPLPGGLRLRRGSAAGPARAAAWIAAALLAPAAAAAAEPGPATALDEVLLRPGRLTRQGQREYASGNHPGALKAFEQARALRPGDAAAQFNHAGALYKNGRFDEAAAAYQSLAAGGGRALAGPAQFNLGNTLYQKQDYPGAVRAYRDALRAMPGDEAARRNLELALRALKQQQQQQQSDKDQKDQQKDPKDDQRRQQDSKAGNDQKKDQRPQPGQQPKTAEQKEQERFQKETGMPKDRAMQLLDALQQNEKAEQKRLRAEQRKEKKGGKDW